MYEDNKLLVALAEVKEKHVAYEDSIRQTIAYSLVALAYCRWGRWRNKKPLVSLLISPDCLYRLTFSKSADRPFGIDLKIEKTEEEIQMEFEIEQYVQNFIHDLQEIDQVKLLNHTDVDPVDWSPINLLSNEFPSSKPWNLARTPNLGFVFKTFGKVVQALQRKFAPSDTTFPNTPSDLPVVVKYLSALLDPRYQRTEEIISDIISKFPAAMAQIVVHPYIGILQLQLFHPLVVMHDMGETLYDLVYRGCSDFRSQWQRSPALRVDFCAKVGMSAINLVWHGQLCHNDIRLPNIALRSDGFALIDFDMARRRLQKQPDSAFSPPLQSDVQWRYYEREMCYSVAQIAVNVFILDASSLFQLSEVQKAICIWKVERSTSSSVDCAFEAWVRSKGAVVQFFINAVREASYPTVSSTVPPFPTGYRLHFQDVLRCMLS
jgi:hypothetical protein